MKVYTQCSLKVTTHYPDCDRNATKVKTVTIIAQQKTSLNVLEQTHQSLVGNLCYTVCVKSFEWETFCRLVS